MRRGRPPCERGVIDVARAEVMRSRYLAGETYRQIGDDYGISGERVRQILRKTNVASLGPRPRKPHALTDAELLAVELYRSGTRPKTIIERTGLTQGQLSVAKKRLGVGSKRLGYWHTRLDDAEITASVCDLYQKGFSAPQIVKRIPQLKFPETVYRYLGKGGVKARTAKGNFRHATAQRSAAA